MGLRAYKRQIAKDRMRVIGIDRINRRMSETNAEGVQNWKVALIDEKAHRAQIAYYFKNRRRIRKIERTEQA